MIKVVAALIQKDGKILIAKRKYGHDNTGGKWEFPGGKVEQNEDEFNAIEREIKEEFELEIKAKYFITNNIHQYSDITIDLRLYACEYIKGTFKLHDHSSYLWIDVKDLLNYELCPADIPLAEYVITNYENISEE